VADHPLPCGSLLADLAFDCGPYKVRELLNADVGTVYYYEATSGALVAIILMGPNNTFRCLGGPTTFVLPGDCTDPQRLPRQCDASAD
jgi:hypothetical protein